MYERHFKEISNNFILYKKKCPYFLKTASPNMYRNGKHSVSRENKNYIFSILHKNKDVINEKSC